MSADLNSLEDDEDAAGTAFNFMKASKEKDINVPSRAIESKMNCFGDFGVKIAKMMTTDT